MISAWTVNTRKSLVFLSTCQLGNTIEEGEKKSRMEVWRKGFVSKREKMFLHDIMRNDCLSTFKVFLFWSTNQGSVTSKCMLFQFSWSSILQIISLKHNRISLYFKSCLHVKDALHSFRNSTDQQGLCGATLADDHFTDGKMQFWRCASMFLEDASSLNRGSTFSTICQGYLRWAKQWCSLTAMPIVGEVLLLAPVLKLFLSSKFSVYLNILSWGRLARSSVALCDQIFTFVCIFYWCL